MSDYDFENVYVELQETLASEAWVFRLVSLNGKCKWPIGYFFQSKCTTCNISCLSKKIILL